MHSINSAIDRRKQRNSISTSADVRKRADTCVTVVISFRERWGLTSFSVESILTNTDVDFDLWLLDTGMPDAVRAALKPYVDAGRLKIINVGSELQPNNARALIIPQLTSEYVVFIDNDVAVSPGWLSSLVACSEETGAGIVCPLYLWGDEPQSDVIHMAGGEAELVAEANGLRFTEKHRHLNRKVEEVAADLKREPVDFGEFHCLMMRREVYAAEGIFSPDVVSVHEHIHASLRAKQLGYETWFEPEARITYLNSAPWRVGELSDFRRRWDFAETERSVRGFAARWGLIDDDEYRRPSFSFVVSHVGRHDLMDARPSLASRRDRAMTPADLQQTFGGWEWLAQRSGYSLDEIQLFANAYVMAIEATNGVYRPCGRPFINHLVGTASVLTFYGCPIQLVLAGLLHSIFGLGEGLESPQSRRAISILGQSGPTAGTAIELAQLYGERHRLLADVGRTGSGLADLPLSLARLVLLDAANEVDMYLSFEIPVSARQDLMPDQRAEGCRQLLASVGLPGFAETLRTVRKEAPALATISFQGAGQGSFRFNGTKIVSAYA